MTALARLVVQTTGVGGGGGAAGFAAAASAAGFAAAAAAGCADAAPAAVSSGDSVFPKRKKGGKCESSPVTFAMKNRITRTRTTAATGLKTLPAPPFFSTTAFGCSIGILGTCFSPTGTFPATGPGDLAGAGGAVISPWQRGH